eukprot:scaffold1237_cov243-Pinguiococcus_pyrenoidosus.AAC.3
MQALYPDFVVMTYFGKGHNVTYRAQDSFYVKGAMAVDQPRSSGQERTNEAEPIPQFLSRVLRDTEQDNTNGRCRPLAIFGYNMMIRGTSFRPQGQMGASVVPTHIVLQMGKMMSIEKMVQAFGRASYTNGPNNDDSVTVLASKLDLDVARAYYVLMEGILEFLREGRTISEIFARGGPLTTLRMDEVPIFTLFLDTNKRFGHKGVIDKEEIFEPVIAVEETKSSSDS